MASGRPTEPVASARWWRDLHPASRRVHVLVESPDRALAVSDFSTYEAAGLDVAFCPGAGSERPYGRDCPLLSGEDCALLEQADVVLHGPDARPDIVAAVAGRHPELAAVVERRAASDRATPPVPEGCFLLAYPCSIGGQLDALHRALARRAPARRAPITAGC